MWVRLLSLVEISILFETLEILEIALLALFVFNGAFTTPVSNFENVESEMVDNCVIVPSPPKASPSLPHLPPG